MVKAQENKRLWITIFILLLLFLSRIPHIGNATAEAGDYWRQTDTESMARNFVEKKFNIFYPQMNYDGPLPNYVQLELQLTTFLIAILYKAFGYHYWLARLVPIGFFITSAFYLFRIAEKLYSTRQAWVTLLIYGALPLNLFFSRAIMPEAALLCFFTGAYYYFIKWIEDERLSTLLLAALFTCLAISQKVPAAFLGLAMLLLCLTKYKARFILRWDLWLFAVISLVPNLIYYLWSYYHAEWKFVSGIATRHIFPKSATAFLAPEALEFYKVNLVEAFGPVPLIFAAAGLVLVVLKKDKFTLFWLLSIVLEVLVIVSVIRFKYYLIMLGPIIALLAGIAIALPWKYYKLGGIVSIALAILVFNSSSLSEQKNFVEVRNRLDGAEILVQQTQKEDLIVIGTYDPALLSISGRAGWRANVQHNAYTPQDPKADIDYYIRNGAKYFLVYKKYIYGDKGDYYPYVNGHFPRAYEGKDYTLYRLN